MLSTWRTWAPVGLLLLGPTGSFAGGAQHSDSSIDETTCTDEETIIDTTTVPVTHYVDVTVSSTKTSIVETCITEFVTTTLYYTVSVTETDSATITNTQTTTATETDSATITNTLTTTATVPATITTYSTQTIFSTTFDPCPTTCSLSVETVNLFYWPTDRPYSYPTTYYDASLDYTFTSPSVYMLIPTAVGVNTLGATVGPSTTSWMLDLVLDEVSTIVDGSITRQLTLSDLGTDCPSTAEPSAIATMVDSRCDPILAAPKQVSSWAYPCNACGRFGLFDPPYAVPTLTGGLIGTTTVGITTAGTSTAGTSTAVTSTAGTTTATPASVQTTTPAPTSTPPVGIIFVVVYSDGQPMATATVQATGVSGTVTTSATVSSTSSSSGSSSSNTTSSGSSTPAATASATRLTGSGFGCLGVAMLMAAILL